MKSVEELLQDKVKVAERKKALDTEIRELYKQIRELETTQTQVKAVDLDLDRAIHLAKREEAQRSEIKQTIDRVVYLCSDLESFSKLHPYQVEDVVSAIQAYDKGLRGILNANDMGMGKTVETVVILHVLKKLMGQSVKILWLTKKSLMEKSSPKEIKRWSDFKVVTPVGTKSEAERDFMLELYEISEADIFMANYEFIRTTPSALGVDWDIVVIDEVHKLKGGANSSGPTAIWKAARDICANARYVLMLSGTPMVNAPEEMWSYLHIFHPERFPDLKHFKRNFMAYKQLAGELTGVLAVDPNKIMQNALKGQMIRRSAEEVGLQLPEFNYEIIELERLPEQDRVYKQMQERFFIWLDEQMDTPLSAMAIVAQLTRLRQINVWPVVTFEVKDENGQPTGRFEQLDVRESSKLDECMDLIDNIQDQVVVFGNFNEPFEEIQRRCAANKLTCGIISGSHKSGVDLEHEFQQGRIDVLCLNMAMGEGLNLQKNPDKWPGGARYGIMLDRWWSPMRNDQCVKRIHRQGSKLPVFIYELQNVPSVDQYIMQLNNDKSASFDSIMNNKEIRPGGEWKEYLSTVLRGN